MADDDLPELIVSSDEDSEEFSQDEDEEASFECDCPHHHFHFDDSDDEEDEHERVYPYMVELLHEFLAMNRLSPFMNVPPRSNTKCKFHMMGKCTRGQFCRFSHDFEPDIPPLIPINQQPQTTTTQQNTENKFSTPCTYYLKGNCLKGNSCKFSHSVNMTWTNPETQNNQTQSQNRTTEVSCSICFESITETKKFGLLSNCNHAFCLECIRGWRKTNQPDAPPSNVRNCPLCRTQSDFVVPSPIFPATSEEKEVIITAYKNSLKNIPCKYFERYHKCPFGKNCFYLHKDVTSNQSHNKTNNNNNNSARTSTPSSTGPSGPRQTAPSFQTPPWKRSGPPAKKSTALPPRRTPPATTSVPNQPRIPPMFQRNPRSFEFSYCSEDSDEDEDEEDEDEEDEEEDEDEDQAIFLKKDSCDDEMPELIEGPLPPRRIETLRAPTPLTNKPSSNTASSTNNTNNRTAATDNNTSNKRITRSVSRMMQKEQNAEDMPPLVPLQKNNSRSRNNSNTKKDSGSDSEMPSLVPLKKGRHIHDNDIPPLVPLRKGSHADSDEEEENDEEESEESSEEETKPAPQRKIRRWYAKKSSSASLARRRVQVQVPPPKQEPQKQEKLPKSKKKKQ